MMEMTTEKVIEIFNDHDRISGIVLRSNSEEETKYNCETLEALQRINVILHKYQKIQEIIKQKDYDRFNSHNYYGYFLRVQDIRKVLEDGNKK